MTSGGTADGAPTSIRLVHTPQELDAVDAVLREVWGTDTSIVALELLVAIAHAGGYVALATDPDGRAVGASVGLLARHDGRPALHSHVTGLLPAARGAGVGRALKLHQRAWARSQGIESIVWTFDPLVRRNAWFNIAVLGADTHRYLPDFYGTMTDAINAGDASDRLYMAWDVTIPLPDRPHEGTGVVDAELVPTPADIVALRRTDPELVAEWRTRTRTALTEALATGRRVLGFNADGNYVIGSGP